MLVFLCLRIKTRCLLLETHQIALTQSADHKAAIKSYFKVMYGYGYQTWQAEATFEAARCFEVLQKPDQAVKLYRELTEKFPDSPRVPPARKKLEEFTAQAGSDPKTKDS